MRQISSALLSWIIRIIGIRVMLNGASVGAVVYLITKRQLFRHREEFPTESMKEFESVGRRQGAVEELLDRRRDEQNYPLLVVEFCARRDMVVVHSKLETNIPDENRYRVLLATSRTICKHVEGNRLLSHSDHPLIHFKHRRVWSFSYLLSERMRHWWPNDSWSYFEACSTYFDACRSQQIKTRISIGCKHKGTKRDVECTKLYSLIILSANYCSKTAASLIWLVLSAKLA